MLTKSWFDFAHFKKNFSIGVRPQNESPAPSRPHWGNGFARFVDRRSRRLAYARTCWGWRGMPRESRMRRGVALGETGLRDRGLAVAGAGRIGVLVIPAKCAT